MTQKELLYFEDAIGHVDNISKILEESMKNIEDEEILAFMQKEKEKQVNLKNDILEVLKEKANG